MGIFVHCWPKISQLFIWFLFQFFQVKVKFCFSFWFFGKIFVWYITNIININKCDSCHPEWVALIPWEQGRCLVCDATIPNAYATSYSTISHTSSCNHKTTKMHRIPRLPHSYLFVLIVIETTGVIGDRARMFFQRSRQMNC